MRDHRSIALRAISCLILAMGLMGNEGCEEAQTKVRALKKRAELGTLNAKKVQLPSGGQFDFQYVMNSQMVDVMRQSEFSFPFVEGASMAFSLGSSELSIMALNDDVELLSSSFRGMDALAFEQKVKDVPECVREFPQVFVSGDVRSFEMTDSGGLSLGFSPSGSLGPITGIGFNFFVEKMELDLGVRGVHPLNRALLSSADVTKNQTKTKLGFNLDMGLLRINPEYYFTTSLSEVSKSALLRATNDLAKNLSTIPWESQVLADKDTDIIIYGGHLNGIEVGDTFDIYNLDYYWKDPKKPCESEFIDAVQSTRAPMAIIEIEKVSSTLSEGRIIERQGNVNPGARVLVRALKLPQPKLDEKRKR